MSPRKAVEVLLMGFGLIVASGLILDRCSAPEDPVSAEWWDDLDVDTSEYNLCIETGVYECEV